MLLLTTYEKLRFKLIFGVTNYCGVTNFIALPLQLLLRDIALRLRCGYGNAVFMVSVHRNVRNHEELFFNTIYTEKFS